MSLAPEKFDVIVIGSGIVGAAAALKLAEQTSLTIAVIDAASPAASRSEICDHRVSAISPASRKILEEIGVWEKIAADRVSSYEKMMVWEERGSGEIYFDSKMLSEKALGYIVEDSVMRKHLHEAFSVKKIHFFHPVKLQQIKENTNAIELIADDQVIYSAKLVIGADGTNSWARAQMQVEMESQDYDHTAIVATVKTTLPHQKTAWQRFLTTGPIAFLPLSEDNVSSIVWSTVPSRANELLAMDDKAFSECLFDAFPKLGEITAVSSRFHFPLKRRHVKNYVKPRFVLMGDAAHTLHPLAGQGVNLGLADAACLADCVSEAIRKERSFAALHTLRKYERARKAEVLLMLNTVGILKKWFMSNSKPLTEVRELGMSFVNKMEFLKKFLMKQAGV